MGKTLVVIGLVIAGLGLLITLGVPLGRLPGDVAVRRGNFSFYFPIVTSIVLACCSRCCSPCSDGDQRLTPYNPKF